MYRPKYTLQAHVAHASLEAASALVRVRYLSSSAAHLYWRPTQAAREWERAAAAKMIGKSTDLVQYRGSMLPRHAGEPRRRQPRRHRSSVGTSLRAALPPTAEARRRSNEWPRWCPVRTAQGLTQPQQSAQPRCAASGPARRDPACQPRPVAARRADMAAAGDAAPMSAGCPLQANGIPGVRVGNAA